MTWLTARQLAGMPGMPGSERRTRDALSGLAVPCRARNRAGGGVEYDCTALPAETRAALMLRQVQAAAPAPSFAPPVPAPAPQPTLPAPLPRRRPPADADKAVADARAQLVDLVCELLPLHGLKRACTVVAGQLASREATAQLQAVARTANQRARGDLVSARTLERWMSLHRAQGWWGLLPAPVVAQPLVAIHDDVAAVLGLYHSKDPKWRNLSHAAKHVTGQLGRPFDAWQPLYNRTRRALAKVDKVALIKARHSGAQRAALLPYKRRDTSSLAPLDVWVIDGHTFKAKVRHPDHGHPFAPELTLALDAATRRIMGWSVSLSENVFAVGDALRHAIGQHGVPAIVYSDNGAGETAKVMDCPIDGFMARLGIDHRTGIPGHPQGHGLIERSWQTHAIHCARQFGSYQGGDVDAGTFRKVAAALAKEQRALRRAESTGEVIQLSPKAPSWAQFIDAVERMVAGYNAQHRHRALPKNAQGKHLTPDEAWAAMLDPALQHKPTQLELQALFMPAELRVAQRGQVTLFNQHYQAPELMAMGVDGERLSVRYDIHDPRTVQVYTLQGRFVCQALWDANRIDYFPKPVVQIAREKRVQAAVKRRQQQIDTALRELRPPVHAAPLSLPEPGAPVVLVPAEVERHDSLLLPREVSASGGAAQAKPGRPSFFDAPSDRYEWLMRHQDDWSDDDAAWARRYVASDEYEGLLDYYAGRGLAWPEQQGGDVFKSAR